MECESSRGAHIPPTTRMGVGSDRLPQRATAGEIPLQSGSVDHFGYDRIDRNGSEDGGVKEVIIGVGNGHLTAIFLPIDRLCAEFVVYLLMDCIGARQPGIAASTGLNSKSGGLVIWPTHPFFGLLDFIDCGS